MLLAALRRFGFLLALAAGITSSISLLVGLALGTPVSRALSVGFYIVGSFLLVAGFFVGNRGPARFKGDETEGGAIGGLFGVGIGSRRLRWATPEEREEALSNSAVFVTLGFALIVLGVLADSRVRLV
ncbi:MAG: hypothetical protein ACRDNX_15000 [Gaiellaceae bacterium]